MMATPELSQLAAFDEWGELVAAVEEELAASLAPGDLRGLPYGPWRRVLANHVSTTCMPKHIGGVIGSLTGCVTYTPTTSASGGGVCELVLPSLFVDVDAPSPWMLRVEADTAQKGEEECCKLTLLFCIALGPDLVRLHSSTLRDPARIR